MTNNAQNTPKTAKNGFAVAGIVLAVFSALLGFVFGFLGLIQASRTDGKGSGLSVTAISLSVITLMRDIALIIVLIIFAVQGKL